MAVACRHSIYYGDAQLATEWFHKLGYTIPYLINAADFILDLASGDVSTKKISGAESREHLIACAERFLSVSSTVCIAAIAPSFCMTLLPAWSFSLCLPEAVLVVPSAYMQQSDQLT